MHAYAHKDVTDFIRNRYLHRIKAKTVANRDRSGSPHWVVTVFDHANEPAFVVSWSPDQGLRLSHEGMPSRTFASVPLLCEELAVALGAPVELHGFAPELIARLGVPFEPCQEHRDWPRPHHRYTSRS